MNSAKLSPIASLSKNAMSGTIVFLVALPLCLGIALASGAPLFSGIIAGIIGGIVIGILSGSHTSVSGPAAGLTAIVASQISATGSFQAFLLAVAIAGVLQIILGLVKAGSLSAFFPSSVIKGLLAAIGTILIIKQLPYLLGYDMVPKSTSPGHSNIFTQISKIFTGEIHLGALIIGLVSLVTLIVWDRIKVLKQSLVPSPLIVVIMGLIMGALFNSLGESMALSQRERFMVNVPVSESISGFLGLLTLPDFSQWKNPAIYIAAVTIAIVASLETLLNLDAVDKLDKKQRLSPPSRELWAQGVGNLVCGMLGGLPVTSVVIRGSVNVNAGSETKLSAIIHGVLLLVCVMLVPKMLNMIPLSCLAAILLMTGFKLVSPKLWKSLWLEGRAQFLPFVITLAAIVATDLLIGITIGMIVSIIFILASNLSLPIRQVIEKHIGGEIRHIELANQVSFLNRAALENALREAPSGAHILLDARRTNYIDPDILSLIREFKEITAPALNLQLSLRGFKDSYNLPDDIQFVDYTTRELQAQLTPQRVLQILRDGNHRFRTGHRLERDLTTADQDHTAKETPMAVIFSGVDPRTPAEMIFDLALGDAYSIRSAGNLISNSVVGSMEFGVLVGKAKLVLVLGHTGSNLIHYAFQSENHDSQGMSPLPNCENLNEILAGLRQSITAEEIAKFGALSDEQKLQMVDAVSRRNVVNCVRQICQKSNELRRQVELGSLAIVGAMFDVKSGAVEFLEETASERS